MVESRDRHGKSTGQGCNFCTYLSAVLLIGLILNSLLGWSWADPIAALVIAAVAVKEGREAWRGDTCCTTAANSADACHDGCCEPGATKS
jgi:hypothetical protein